ncbi:UNVERIFIED_CONTAM: Germin-like protein subfamily 1 member 13 [Sesamum angustifolium]|uniref:Germin-like protein n=1 Tax=Sesamum angustifolium TaxID=2727405 RepID=A0AAW2NJW8_9LAMI
MKISALHVTMFIAILAVGSSPADAYDPDQLQDFCVAVNDSKAAVFVNGKICKDQNRHGSTPSAFFSHRLCTERCQSDEHPRASEILVVLEGTLYAGFITTNPPNPNDKNKLFAKILKPGDVFVFPKVDSFPVQRRGKPCAPSFKQPKSWNQQDDRRAVFKQPNPGT